MWVHTGVRGAVTRHAQSVPLQAAMSLEGTTFLLSEKVGVWKGRLRKEEKKTGKRERLAMSWSVTTGAKEHYATFWNKQDNITDHTHH